MARKIMIAGNWKMNGLSEDGVALAREVAAEVKKRCAVPRSRSVRKMPILRSRALTPATSARPC